MSLSMIKFFFMFLMLIIHHCSLDLSSENINLSSYKNVLDILKTMGLLSIQPVISSHEILDCINDAIEIIRGLEHVNIIIKGIIINEIKLQVCRFDKGVVKEERMYSSYLTNIPYSDISKNDNLNYKPIRIEKISPFEVLINLKNNHPFLYSMWLVIGDRIGDFVQLVENTLNKNMSDKWEVHYIMNSLYSWHNFILIYQVLDNNFGNYKRYFEIIPFQNRLERLNPLLNCMMSTLDFKINYNLLACIFYYQSYIMYSFFLSHQSKHVTFVWEDLYKQRKLFITNKSLFLEKLNNK